MKGILYAVLLSLIIASTIPLLAHGDEDHDGNPVAEEHAGDAGGDADISVGGNNIPNSIWLSIGGGIVAAAIVAFSPLAASNRLMLAIAALTGATAVIHLLVAGSDTLLILNGLGYIGLLGLLVLPIEAVSKHRATLLLVIIAYTGVTIVGYFATHSSYDTVGIFTKAVEALLIVAALVSIMHAGRPQTLQAKAVKSR